jgi:hypothetical protein
MRNIRLQLDTAAAAVGAARLKGRVVYG